ncbi:hypothetical protein GCM10022254_36160 [Actinomadura meridiana]|uniref:DUF397 domain-containing protein n=1 Tax=Actinomadura meridiana TaxID=559626 RepID=A0ABP8C4D3_9ACTN
MKEKLGVHWRKSSHSDHSGGHCVEVAYLVPVIGIRDSREPGWPVLTLAPAAWEAVITNIRFGMYHRP